MKSNNKTKSFKDSFYDFFDNPSRDKFRDLMLDNTGEHNDLDFKMEVPDSYPIIAKDIIAMANKAGGLLIFGVVEDKTINSFEPVGLVNATEKTEFETNIKKYLPDQLNYEVHDLKYASSEYKNLIDKFFRVILINYNPEYIPFLPVKDGKGILKTDIYIRDNTSTVKANFSHIQDIINRRLATGHSSARELSLQEHFDELKRMYSLVSKGRAGSHYQDSLYDNSNENEGDYYFVKNPKYPNETLEDFILKMIELKKQVITSIVTANRY